MSRLADGVLAFYNDLKNQGLLGSTLIVSSPIRPPISENGSPGTDHGAGGLYGIGGGDHGAYYARWRI